MILYSEDIIFKINVKLYLSHSEGFSLIGVIIAKMSFLPGLVTGCAAGVWVFRAEAPSLRKSKDKRYSPMDFIHI